MKTKIRFSQVIIFVLATAIIVCIVFVSNATLDNREAALVSIILSLLSIIASYLTSQYFSEIGHKQALEEVRAQHTENLKTYAINAAEKVDNLSKELQRLSIFLEDELAKPFEEAKHGFRSRTERLESAIHMLGILKSVNDTSLSDWRGVIPEELEEKDEELQEREAELQELIDRVEELAKIGSYENDRSSYVMDQISDLRRQILYVSRRIDGVRIRPKRSSNKPLKESVNVACSSCGNEIAYKQRPMANSYKSVNCASCDCQYTGRWYPDKGFVLEPNVAKSEEIACLSCANTFAADVDTLIHSSKQVTCPTCEATMKVTRTIKGVRRKNMGGPPTTIKKAIILDEDMLQKIQQALPSQPWPKGVHMKVADELGVKAKLIQEAVRELIKRGIRHPQIDGVVYYRKEEVEEGATRD
ncbi:MAG: hypothetical protein ACYSWO_23860 [Planctomycetota bacterium]|jgi:DNA-directed RNA polymerase subunit RPC12/RpoP